MILVGSRPDPPAPEPVNASLTLHLTRAEKIAVRVAAADAGVSMSAWGRAALKASLG